MSLEQRQISQRTYMTSRHKGWPLGISNRLSGGGAVLSETRVIIPDLWREAGNLTVGTETEHAAQGPTKGVQARGAAAPASGHGRAGEAAFGGGGGDHGGLVTGSTVATWWQLGKQCESCGVGGSQQRSPAESSPQENRIDTRDTENEGVRLRAQ